MYRKPDCVPYQDQEFSDVPTAKDVHNELQSCSYGFAAQHNRQFVLDKTDPGAEMILFVSDRSGVIGSKTDGDAS